MKDTLFSIVNIYAKKVGLLKKIKYLRLLSCIIASESNVGALVIIIQVKMSKGT